jgi:putative aldouronate transport system substrate-binding protein
MKKRSILSLSLVASMIVGVAGCTSSETTTSATTKEAVPDKIETTTTAATSADESKETEKKENYQYGLNKTFHSDEKVTYTMFFSDASWYAMQDTWKTEGIFKKLEDITNVHLDIISYDSNDYMNNVTLDINAGESAYIIPKIYDDSAFVDGGAIVPISDYVQYMPNYVDFYNKYNMAPDVKTITRANGKYYKLPGMKEDVLLNYTFVIREDIFKAAGVDVASQEATWTWEDLLEDLKTVKAYMVKNGMCKESDYIWSDLWCGGTSGHGNGGNLLNVIATTYDCSAGWGFENNYGLRYDQAKDEFYFNPITDNYKEYLKMANAFVEAGILDPETFTQEDDVAQDKFYTGKTVIMSVNQGTVAGTESKMIENLGEGKYELYYTIPPRSKLYNYSTAGNARLENGVMISKKALDELGEEDFIKMLRFVDWLWYSEEGYTFHKWGIEGETYEIKDGKKVLKDGYCNGGLGFGNNPEGTLTDVRLKWGYGGGNFFYGHTVAEMSDAFTPQVAGFTASNAKNRETPPLAPGVAPTEDQNEQINLLATPLLDEVNSWSLSFVIGQKKIDDEWDNFVKACEGKDCAKLVELYNKAYKG